METSFLIIALGVVFLVISIGFWIRTSGRRKTMTPWKAVITRIERHMEIRRDFKNDREKEKAEEREEHEERRAVYIEYDYEGKKYERELGHYIAGMSEGKEIEILIDPRDPSKISSKGDRILSVILAVLGAVLLLAGLYSFVEG
jgi:hypothetical protein